MTYELAKELKDAGFPQDKAEFYYGAGYASNHGTRHEILHRNSMQPLHTWLEYIAAPTLPELIEACRRTKQTISLDEVLESQHGPYHWEAVTRDEALYQGEMGDDVEHVTTGPTPDIAAARLWLALNKHD